MLGVSRQLGQSLQRLALLDPQDLERLAIARVAGPANDLVDVADRVRRQRLAGELAHRAKALQKGDELIGMGGRVHAPIADIRWCSCEAMWRAGSGVIAFR